MGKDLREGLYRARATMAEMSRTASEWGGAQSHCLMGFQQVDKLAQDGVEDADKTLIEYEQTNIFELWVCADCNEYELPGFDDEPYCHHKPMKKVRVERMD